MLLAARYQWCQDLAANGDAAANLPLPLCGQAQTVCEDTHCHFTGTACRPPWWIPDIDTTAVMPREPPWTSSRRRILAAWQADNSSALELSGPSRNLLVAQAAIPLWLAGQALIDILTVMVFVKTETQFSADYYSSHSQYGPRMGDDYNRFTGVSVVHCMLPTNKHI